MHAHCPVRAAPLSSAGMFVAPCPCMRKNLQLSRWAAVVLLAAVAGVVRRHVGAEDQRPSPHRSISARSGSNPPICPPATSSTGPTAAQAPPPESRFELIAEDRKGYSRGYDVRDRQGVKWSVKVGKEASARGGRVAPALGHRLPSARHLHRDGLAAGWCVGAARGSEAGALPPRPRGRGSGGRVVLVREPVRRHASRFRASSSPT